jgi:hypothetical protein
MTLKEAMDIVQKHNAALEDPIYRATIVVLNALETALVAMGYFATESVAIKNALERMKNETN